MAAHDAPLPLFFGTLASGLQEGGGAKPAAHSVTNSVRPKRTENDVGARNTPPLHANLRFALAGCGVSTRTNRSALSLVKLPHLLLRTSLLAATAATLVLFAGCAGGPPKRRAGGPPPDGGPQLVLRGEARFFQERLHVEVTVLPMQLALRRAAPARDGASEGRRPRGGPPGGGPPGGGRREEAPRETGPRSAMTLAGGPATQLHLKFTNTSAEPLTVSVREFVSAFGNFAVQPEQLTLAPGASGEFEPMASSRGIDIALDASLALALGTEHEVRKLTLALHESPPVSPP